ncbi:hypothetical protein PHLGIDRAFT_121223 [Phlebiopsis gigantea 11061_1 CR5-6]|uniref:DUF6533 domain-containing protein n=1 Tax=Phlebiopsis gigantea (strain 11061_1 CR5-6) TaxID=745531 RepID=A0A0C3NGJ9_PHLG1|nr:hypothetical protein PHLGIDRAFT_121223 [Phlebiopsis gigantea 11061_1 CR5-6]
MPSSATPSGLAPSDGPLSMLTSADHLFVAIPALVVYEYVITFEQELAVVWRRKFTLVSLLLIVIRWTLLVEAVFLVLPQPSEDVVSISGRAPVVLAEAIIIVITWMKTFNGRHAIAHLQDSMTLTQYILRDGTLFFVAMLILNTVMLIIIISDSNIGFTGPLMDILPPILISRFILNIRRSATHSGHTREESEMVSSQTITGIVFREVSAALDELGRELDDGQPHLTLDPPASTQRMSGLSNFLLFDRASATPGGRSSWVTQTDRSSVDTVTDESISGEEEPHQ